MKVPRYFINNIKLAFNKTFENIKKISLIMAEKRSLNEDESSTKKLKKIKNRKFAVMLCYSGHGYYGLQRNEPFKTIEGDLLNSFLKANIINEEMFKTPKLFRFQRAARTDKGVSATRQIISCFVAEDSLDKIDLINKNLPEQIRVFSIRRTTPSFDCRNFCDARTYSYTFPTFAISPPKTLITTFYRIDKELIDKFNDILSVYKGTHNFHNFTSGKSFTDASSMRYIIDINCSQPFLYEDMEFAKITIKGQSFVLHQIRKMVGLAIYIMRGYKEINELNESFLSQKKDIPIAPGLGLLLENIHYDIYNKKHTGNGKHEPLIWTEFNNEIEEFKEKYIFKNIYDQEKNKFSMMSWLDTLRLHKNNVMHNENNSISENENIKDEKNENLINEKIEQLKDKNDEQLKVENLKEDNDNKLKEDNNENLKKKDNEILLEEK